MNGKHDLIDGGRSMRQRLLAGVGVTERRLPLAGVSTAVLQAGAGPPVVLLHSSGEFAALWSRVIPDLATTHRVVAPDLPGHGASVVDGGLDADRVLGWLAELIHQTCPSAPALVAHGLSGAVAARFAAEHGDRVDRLVLVDTFGLVPFEPAPSFGSALHRFLEQPTEETRDGLFEQCFVDLDRLRTEMGPRWEAAGRVRARPCPHAGPAGGPGYPHAAFRHAGRATGGSEPHRGSDQPDLGPP